MDNSEVVVESPGSYGLFRGGIRVRTVIDYTEVVVEGSDSYGLFIGSCGRRDMTNSCM